MLEFWEVTKAELAEARAALRVAAREAEAASEAHAAELRASTQKVKHLQYEHASALAAAALDKETALKVQADEFRRVEDALMCAPPGSPCAAFALRCVACGRLPHLTVMPLTHHDPRACRTQCGEARGAGCASRGRGVDPGVSAGGAPRRRS